MRKIRRGGELNEVRSVPSGPVLVPQIKPETEEEIERYDAALRRKQLSLILAGKMQPKDAHELKALFKD